MFRCSLLIVLNSFFVVSCLTSIDQDVSLSSSSSKQEMLRNKIKNNNRKKEVIENFETRFVVSANFLSSDVIEGIKTSAWLKDLDESRRLVEKSKNRISFLVSVYSLKNEFSDLKNNSLWDLSLQVDGEILKPNLIERSNKKEYLKTLFPGVNLWTNEYLIGFGENIEKIDKNTIQLNLSNPQSGIAFSWLK